MFMAWLAQSERAFSVYMLQVCKWYCSPQTLGEGAQDRTFRFVISLDLFLAVQCCCLRSSFDRNHHLTHPRVTARGDSD